MQGLIQTEMTQLVLEKVKTNEALSTALTRTSALERFGNPEEVIFYRCITWLSNLAYKMIFT